MKHRCSVCWAEQTSHEAWFEHAVEAHGADTLAEFGYNRCQSVCPGEDHAKRLPNYGQPPRPRTRPEPQPFTARDGTVYTPVPLFEDRSA